MFNAASSPPVPQPSTPRWRLADAKEYLQNGVLKLVTVSSLEEKAFVAISYEPAKSISQWKARIADYGSAHGRNSSYEKTLELGSSIFSMLTQRTLIDKVASC